MDDNNLKIKVTFYIKADFFPPKDFYFGSRFWGTIEQSSITASIDADGLNITIKVLNKIN